MNGGTLAGGALSGTVTSTTGGTISSVGGSAAVTATGGTTTFTGSNTYSGTTAATGTAILAAGNANAFSANSAVSLATGTTLDLGSANQTIGSLNGTAGTVTSLTNPTGAGATAVLTVAGSGSFGGVIANGQATTPGAGVLTGLNVVGGTLTLTGANTYTGATTVGPEIAGDTATLVIASPGSIAASSSITVNSGGTLGGNGTIGGGSPAVSVPVTVNAGGTLTPGVGGSGMLNINGTLTLAAGSDYQVSIGASGATSTDAAVTGSASVSGIFTAVANSTIGYSTTPYSVLTATSGVSGTFSGITIATGSNFGDYVPYLSYTANAVQLDLTAGTVWSGTNTSNNWNVGGAGGNWSGSAVPSASASNPQNTVATFTGSGTTNVAITTNATASALLFTSTVTSPYIFTINGGGSLALSGVGIDDNSSGGGANAPQFTLGGATGGTLTFQNAATAGAAVINVDNNGLLQFQGNSSGGTAQLNLSGTGVASFSASLGPGNNGINTIGSLTGANTSFVYLGDTTLAIGNGGTFAGTISDCGPTGRQCTGNANGATGGSLVVGGGTLMLSGANTYTGSTVIDAGATLNIATNTNYNTGGPSSGILNSAIGTGTLLFNGGTLQAGDANFSTDLTGFTLANAAQITHSGGTIDAAGQIFTLSGNISDNALSSGGALNIVNSNATAGTVVFSGTNSYSGDTIVGGGTSNPVTLAAGAGNAFSPNSAMTVNANATLDLGSLNQTVGSLSGSGTVTSLSNPSSVAAGTTAVLIVGTPGATTTFGGVIADGQTGTPAAGVLTGLTVAGGSLTLNGANTYTGATTINAGATLVLGTTLTISTSSAVTNNGTLDLGNNGTILKSLSGTNAAALVGNFSGTPGAMSLVITDGGSYAGVIEDGRAGSTTLLDVTGGTLALSGANTYSNTTIVGSGATVQVGNNNALGTNTVTLDGGSTLRAGAAGLTLSNGIALSTSGSAVGTVDANSNTLTLSGAISGGNLAIEDRGTAGGGSIVLSGTSNTYTGATNINSGTLVVTGDIHTSSGVAVNSGGTLAGTGAVSRVNVANGGTLSPGTTSNPIGTLTINGSLTIASGANYVATVTGSDTTDRSLTSVSGAASLAGTLTLAGSGGAISTDYEIISAGSVAGKFSGINITGSFGNDLPTLIYGATEVQLSLVAGTVWQGSTAAGGTEWTAGGNWVGGTAPSGASGVAAFDSTQTKSTTVTISSTDPAITIGTLLFNSNITTASQAITFDVNGTLTLATNGVINESTTTTPTFNVAGSLLFSGNSTAGNSQLNVLQGGTVDFSGSTGPANNNLLSVGSISNGIGNLIGGSIYLGSNTLQVGSNNLSTTFSGTISDCGTSNQCAAHDTGGSLEKVGSGTLTLSGTNTYTGGTTISAGTLQAASAGAISSGTLTLNGGTFQAGAATLAFNNNVALGNLGGAVDSFGKSLTLSGVISGSGTLNVGSSIGSGTLTLSNTSSYTGATNVNSGTLAVTGDIRTSSLLTVNSSGTLAGTGNVGAVSVMDGGTFAPGTNTLASQLNVHGSLTLSSAATYMVTINGPAAASPV